MRVLIVDDHPLYRDGLKALLMGLDAEAEVADAANVNETLALAADGRGFDLVLLDMNMPGPSRLAALKQIKDTFEDASVVVVSGDEDPTLILQAVDAGAAGYIPKSTDQAITINALRLVLAHGIYLPPNSLRLSPGMGGYAPTATSRSAPELSDRQRAVLRRLLQGKANKVIARELDIAEGTVKAHLWAVYQLLGVSSRAQAMCRAHELGLLDRLG